MTSACSKLLKMISDCRTRMAEARAQGARIEPPVGLMLERGLDFTCDTLKAIREQYARSRIPQSEILLRALFEVSVSLLWASRERDGWKRLQADAAITDRTWAEKARSHPDHAATAKAVLADPIRAACAKNGKALPNMRQMLQAISDRDQAAAVSGQANTDLGDYLYYAIYGLLSRTTHGHLVAIKRQIAVQTKTAYLRTGVVICVLFTIRAVYHAFGWDVEPLYRRVARMMRPNMKLPGKEKPDIRKTKKGKKK